MKETLEVTPKRTWTRDQFIYEAVLTYITIIEALADGEHELALIKNDEIIRKVTLP